MKAKPANPVGMRAWARAGRPLLAALLALVFSAPPGLAQRARVDSPRSAATGPARSDAKLPPGQRMYGRVLREAFPTSRKQVHPPSAQQPAGANAIPARNAIGLSLQPGANRIDTARKSAFLPAASAAPNVVAAGPPAINASKLAVQPRPPGPAPVSPATTLRTTSINGTTMNRNGSGPGGIGGPARSATGINGTSFRPRHQN
jgi:hypothetical protein